MPEYIDLLLRQRQKPPEINNLSERIIERSAFIAQKQTIKRTTSFIREFFDSLVIPQPATVFALCLVIGFTAGFSLELSSWDIYTDQWSDFLYIEEEV